MNTTQLTSSSLTKKKIGIAFHFDLVCPWCLIGLRHLNTAIAAFRQEAPEIEVEVEWYSQILLPQIPTAGVPYKEFYEQRLGGPENVAARRAQVRAAAIVADFIPAFDDIQLMPNTRAAHLLVDHLRSIDPTRVGALVERLLLAFFVEGEDIGNIETLTLIGATFYLAPATTRAYLTDTVQAGKMPRFHGTAINGVPHFVIDEQRHLSGAAPPESLLANIRAAASATRVAA